MKFASSCTLWYKFARVCEEEEEVHYAWFGVFVLVWWLWRTSTMRHYAWRWSLVWWLLLVDILVTFLCLEDYVTLAFGWCLGGHCYTWRFTLLMEDCYIWRWPLVDVLEGLVFEFGGLFAMRVCYICRWFLEDDDLDALLHWLMTWRLCYVGWWLGDDDQMDGWAVAVAVLFSYSSCKLELATLEGWIPQTTLGWNQETQAGSCTRANALIISWCWENLQR